MKSIIFRTATKLFSLTGTILLITSSVSATPFDGAYDASVDRCYRPSDSRIIISWDNYEFWEGGCRLSNATTLRGLSNGILYDAQCWAEDTQYSKRVMLIGNSQSWMGQQQIGIDLYMVQDGVVSAYVKCPAGSGTTMYQ